MVRVKLKYIILIVFVLLMFVIPNYSNGTSYDNLKDMKKFTLFDGNFVGAGQIIDGFSIFVIILCCVFVFIAQRLWRQYGKDEPVIETVEFYPPEGFNSAEVGFLYEGVATNENVISLLIYLANKGYLKIEETEEKSVFSKSKGFKITKLKEYDGDNGFEKMFFNGIFSDFSINETVTQKDLYNSFYITLNKIKKKLNSKENKEKVFEIASARKEKLLVLMIVVVFILITVKPLLEYGKVNMLLFTLFFPGIGFGILIGSLIGAIENKKTTGVILGACVGGLPWLVVVMPVLMRNTMYLIMGMIGIISVVVILFFIAIMPKRTAFGNEMLGKLRGFKRFLETAEKPQLESLVMQNPEYFYNILPYTYALGVSDVWISQFETIALQAPNWYDCHGSFNVHSFGEFINSTMSSATTAMSSSPSSSGGGGSSGGGSGGGGGGSW